MRVKTFRDVKAVRGMGDGADVYSLTPNIA